MAAVSLFRNTNMAAVRSRENILLLPASVTDAKPMFDWQTVSDLYVLGRLARFPQM